MTDHSYRWLLTTIAVFVFVPYMESTIAATETAKPLSQGTVAKPLKRHKKPISLTGPRRKKEGWVQISFVISKEGKVVDPVIVNSFGGPIFERAAIESVLGFEYEPATWNGMPVQQARNTTIITYALKSKRHSASGKFRKRYATIGNLLDAGELEKADALIMKTHEEWDMSLYELSKLWTARAHFESLAGDKKKQLRAIQMATINSGKWIEKNAYESLLFIEFAVELELGNISNALRVHRDLVQLKGKRKKDLEELSKVVNSLEKMVASDSILKIPAELERRQTCTSCAASWRYNLLRHEFSLTNVDGELSALDIRCDRNRVRDKVRIETTWKIPASRGNCRVTVFGDPGTSFDLLEWPTGPVEPHR